MDRATLRPSAALAPILWPPTDRRRAGEVPLSAYALLDAARDERIFDGLLKYQEELEFDSLYQGQLAEDLAEVAPYLVRLEPGHPFTDWLLDCAWGESWGIFVQARLDLDEVRRHLRKFTVVWTESGQSMIFRFYDPRVLRLFLPTCPAEDLTKFFGPLHRLIVEDADPATALHVECREGALVSLPVALGGQPSPDVPPSAREFALP